MSTGFRGACPPLREAALVLGLTVAAVCLPTAATAQLTDADAMAAQMIGEGLGRNLGQAIAAVGQMQARAAEASREIEAARRAYWDAVRTGRNVPEARREFAHHLQGKDLLNMWLAIPGGVQDARYQLFEKFSVDGGIRPWARAEFMEWVDAIRAHLGAHGDRFILPAPAQVAEAVEATRPKYDAYLRARDWAEVDDSGLTWPWDTDARAHALMVLRRYTDVPAEAAEQTLADWMALFGEAQVLAVAERLRTARRDRMSNLADPQAIGVRTSQPYNALVHLLRSRDGRAAVTWHVWQDDARHRTKTPAEALHEMERYVWAYGPQAVEQAGRSIAQPGQYVFPVWLLRYQHPEGRIREAAAFSRKVKDAAQVDELHRELLQRYDRQRLIEASDVVLRRHWRDESPLREENYGRLRERHEGDPYAMLIEVLDRGEAAVLDAALPAAEGVGEIYRAEAPARLTQWSAAERQASPASFGGTAGRALYGLTQALGVFRVNVDGSGFRVLHQFSEAQSTLRDINLLVAPDGTVYGSVDGLLDRDAGGRLTRSHLNGAIFRVRDEGPGLEIVADLAEHRVRNPRLLLIDDAGVLFGTARGQPQNAVFSMQPDGSAFRLLQQFPGQLEPPWALVDGRDGFIYGLARQDPLRAAVFRVRKDGTGYEVVHQLDDVPNHFVGLSQLIVAGDGRLYGSKLGGPTDPARYLFRLNRDGSEFTVLHRLERGDDLFAPLVEGADGMLYTTRRERGRGQRDLLVRIGTDGTEVAEIPLPAARIVDLIAHPSGVFGVEAISQDAIAPGAVYRLAVTAAH